MMRGEHGSKLGGRNLFLMIALLAMLLFHPFVRSEWMVRLTRDAALSIIMLAGITAVSNRRFSWVVSTLLALPALVGRWVGHAIPRSDLLSVISLLSLSLFLLFNSGCVLANVVRQRRVTADTIYGAVSVYILMGLMFSGIFMALQILQPESFHLAYGEGAGGKAAESQIMAFSFVTLTTVGYGDITPASPVSRALCNLEAIFGQMYLAVLVARLVGVQVSQSKASD